MAARTLNFDELDSLDVIIGGRTFTLKPQRRSLLQKVLAEAFKEQEPNEKDEMIEGMFKSFKRQLPVFPLLFDFEDPKSDDYKVALAHFEEHLSPAAAVTIFKEWWTLNQVDDFFLRLGMPLYPPNLMGQQQQQFQEEVLS